MLSVRYASREDLPSVYVMYLASLKEVGEKYSEKDALDTVLSGWAQAPCILLVEDEEIVGFAGLYTFCPSYNKSKSYLRDYMFYTKPTHRGIKSWRALGKAVQGVADKFKIDFLGNHRLEGEINNHLRLIKMAGAKAVAVSAIYEAK